MPRLRRTGAKGTKWCLLITGIILAQVKGQLLGECDLSRCSGHGSCSGTGCTCWNHVAHPIGNSQDDYGHWTGADCGRCVSGWGPEPDVNGGAMSPIGVPYCSKTGCSDLVTCHGHGVCDWEGPEPCTCTQSDEYGYWNSTSNCADCASGWVGDECKDKVDGDDFLAKAPELPPNSPCEQEATCNSHGTCITGSLHGDAAPCNCFASTSFGYFSGRVCDECAQGYYPEPGQGASPCTIRCTSCPGGTCNSKGECKCKPSQCNGHGTCVDTPISGTACQCNASLAEGFWNPTTNCSTCDDGYTLASGCKSRAPAVPVVVPVPIPPVPVPRAPVNSAFPVCTPAMCGSHGHCNPQLGGDLCSCFQDQHRGYWFSGSNCTTCRSGYVGPDCKEIDLSQKGNSTVLVTNGAVDDNEGSDSLWWVLLGSVAALVCCCCIGLPICYKLSTQSGLSPPKIFSAIIPDTEQTPNQQGQETPAEHYSRLSTPPQPQPEGMGGGNNLPITRGAPAIPLREYSASYPALPQAPPATTGREHTSAAVPQPTLPPHSMDPATGSRIVTFSPQIETREFGRASPSVNVTPRPHPQGHSSTAQPHSHPLPLPPASPSEALMSPAEEPRVAEARRKILWADPARRIQEEDDRSPRQVAQKPPSAFSPPKRPAMLDSDAPRGPVLVSTSTWGT